VLRDWARMLLKRSPKREVMASMGIEMAMMELMWWEGVGVGEWKWEGS
jgi:3-methyladenine DNA glycosylase/8-oxoguanine DNA glycosylase